MPTFTSSLLASDPAAYARATTSSFLTSASLGETPKPLLGRWLANDRLYIHAYIRGSGRLLSFLPLPDQAPAVPAGQADAAPRPRDPETKLLDWLVFAMQNVRREENFFLTTAAAFGIDVNLNPASDSSSGAVAQDDKLEGLRRWESLFDSLAPGPKDQPLPWFEAAVVFWGTEVCYLDAWTGVRDRLDSSRDAAQDADGGALRKEFIPNWTNDEFVQFVNDIRDIIDQAVDEAVAAHGESVRQALYERALPYWKKVLDAEETFWPA